jgi:Alpha/beta hydrolase domain
MAGVVTGPVEGAHRPFSSPPFGIEEAGYVMEEFLVEGTAGSYRPSAPPGRDGRWEAEPGPEADYRTRIYVVRPADPADFNGIVLANWQNVTAGFDLGMPPPEAYCGYAWVGITAQHVAVHGMASLGPGMVATNGLVGEDPERYATLHHPGDEYCYDIFTQAAATVAPKRPMDAVDPLDGLTPRLILATGSSQSAMRLGSYLNMVHARVQMFDGFLLLVHWGLCPPPPNQELLESFTPLDTGLCGGHSRIRDDGVPILVLSSETEVLSNYPVRQPDTDSFRFWEMAGTAHATGAGLDDFAEFLDRFVGTDPSVLQANTVQWNYVADAALRHLVRWVENGEAPPHFPLIDVDAGPPATIHRDQWGNATGGVRLPDVIAPTAHNRGDNDVNILVAMLGESVPFTPDELAARYPSRTDYLAEWDGAVDALLTAGLDLEAQTDSLRARGRKVADERFPADR